MVPVSSHISPLESVPTRVQEIQWTGWGVFDTRRLAAGANTDPRFQTIKVDGKLVGGSAISQATLDELAGAAAATGSQLYTTCAA